ncbi:hypothetical protein POVWA2_048310 [Plasmodium ovale wallikeri]|uniref:Uncharacterized protein n=1 Tax=Plasmodium ovale wallikeri TaxID=864142 RepID=A0A1A8ZL79_PLAOA|nr:hypothetical protein POVWA1_039420 [Plasmodium ovale wallikeri]SBT44605.1 hypothetical protein POVWA2_048310 [Plasmodium ovale wallikeri]
MKWEKQFQRYHFSSVGSEESFVHSSTDHQRSFLVHISPHFHCFILSDLHTFTLYLAVKCAPILPPPPPPLRGTPKFEYKVLSQQKLLAPSIKNFISHSKALIAKVAKY